MKDTKRQIELYTPYVRDDLESHLEQMAEKGWMIEKAEGLFWAYRRTEPRRLHFTVTYFAKASLYHPQPTEKQTAFYEFCEHTGWKLAASGGQMQIFYN